MSQARLSAHSRCRPSAAGGAAAALLLLLLAALACGCHRRATPPPRPGVPVRVAEVVARAVPVEIAEVGNAVAIETVSVRAHVGGILERVYFVEGQCVARGDPLFLIDPVPYRAALEQARGALARDEAQAENAARNRDRYARLLRRGLVAAQDYEAQRATAEAWRATLEADRGAVTAARSNLDYTRIEAPLAGKTGSLLVNRGNLVKADDTGALVVIRQLAPIYVVFAVPATDLPAIQRRRAEGSLLVTAQPAGAEREVAGRLTFVDNTVDATTATVILKATFDNVDHALWPGQYVTARLRLETLPDALTVPAQAVLAGQRGSYVFVVGLASQAEQRPVEVAFRSGGLAVIRRGLAAGEHVVTDGQLNLVPGARVQRVQGEDDGGPGDGGSSDGGDGGR